MNLVAHLSQWLPHLNLLNVFRNWQFVMLLRYSSKLYPVLERVSVIVFDPLCALMPISCSVLHLKINLEELT